MKITALIADTFREIYARKVILGIIVIEVLTLLITGLILFSDGMQEIYREAAEPIPAVTLDSVAVDTGTDSAGAVDTTLLGADDPFAALDSSLHDSTLSDTTQQSAFEPSPALNDSSVAEAGKDRPLLEMVKGQMGSYAAVIALATVFLGIFATAGIVPSMMEKGTIDLLISKPLPRSTLLFGRTLGGLIAIAINLALFVLAMWTLYGIATGVWYLPFVIWTFLVPLFTFIVIYSFVIMLNVLTESWILPMSLAYVHLAILSNFLFSREETVFTFVSSPVLQRMIDGLYYILPQTTDLFGAVPTLVFTSGLDDIGPFIHGAIFSIVMLALAAWKFERRDF